MFWVQAGDAPQIISVREAHELPSGKLRVINAAVGYQQNPLSDDAVARFTGLGSLKDLDLGPAKLSDESLQQLSECPELETLGVNTELLTAEGLGSLTSFSNLRRLTLWGANLPLVNLDFVSRIPQLSELQLNGFRWQPGALQPLRNCESLTALAMHSEVRQETWDDLAQIKSLRRLELASPINLEAIQPISKVTQVTHVRLATYYKDEHVRALKDVPNLEVIDLALPDISDEAIDSLSQLPNLKFLRVRGKRSMAMFGAGWNSLRGLGGFTVNTPPDFWKACPRGFQV